MIEARSRPVAIAAAMAVASIVLVACGGHAATRKGVIAQGDAICFAAQQSIHSVPPPAGGLSALPQLSSYLDKVVPLLDKEVTQLRALPRPKRSQETLDRFITAAGQELTAYRELASAANRGDSGGVQRALDALRANPTATLARVYGLTECTGAAGTVD